MNSTFSTTGSTMSSAGANLALWHAVLVAGLRDDRPDLTMRQLAVLLTVYVRPQPHTVRGLARALDISKPAVTRALDRLGALNFAKRKRDPDDGRNVLVQRTIKGSVYLSDFAELVAAAALKQGDRTAVAA